VNALNGVPGGRPTIQTYTGSYFDFTDPENSEIDIRDIAHGLANLCRFTGHTREFYSVAQHSVLMAVAVGGEHGFKALMHDAHEAYVGDMASPLKALVPGFKEIEKRIEAAVLGRFGISLPLPPVIKESDLRMLLTEQQALMTPPFNHWAARSVTTPYPDLVIRPWSTVDAERRFLLLFDELMPDGVTGSGLAVGGALPVKGGKGS
jgi:uncharacterized protein